MAVKAIPDGYHSVTPYLVVSGVATLLDFLTQAFEAHELHRMPRPGGPRLACSSTEVAPLPPVGVPDRECCQTSGRGSRWCLSGVEHWHAPAFFPPAARSLSTHLGPSPACGPRNQVIPICADKNQE